MVTATRPEALNELPQVVLDCLKKPGVIATLPTVATELMRLANDPDSSVSDVVPVINADPTLCARVLKIANSSFYGFSREIGSIKHAITLLGLNAVKNIALAGSLHKVFRLHQKMQELCPQELWKHSLAVAVAAGEVSKVTGAAAVDEAFLAGLMHDVGIIIEMQAFPTEFGQFGELISKDVESNFRRTESQVFGASHEEFGAGLCRTWNFPPSIELAVAKHHSPEPVAGDSKLPAVVQLAEVAAQEVGVGFSREADGMTASSDLLETLGLSDDPYQEVIKALPEAISEATAIFSM